MADEQGEEYKNKPGNKTIYDTGYGSIFAKNFLAGFSRALGAIFVYLMFAGLIFYFFMTYLMPQLQNVISNLSSLLDPSSYLQNLPTTNNDENDQSTYTISPEQFNQAL